MRTNSKPCIGKAVIPPAFCLFCMAPEANADLVGIIKGVVIDGISCEPLENVRIETSKNGSALSDENGEYEMSWHPSGEFALKAEYEGYALFEYPGELAVEGVETVNILMLPEIPSISPIEDKSVGEDIPTSIPFRIGGASMPDFVLSGTSPNPDIIPDTGITFGGDGIERTIGIRPNANVSGETTITVAAKDADGTILVQTSFKLTVTGVPGDVDNSKAVDLVDAILSLKILTGITTSGNKISLYADINGDQTIGAEETIYILQIVSGERSR